MAETTKEEYRAITFECAVAKVQTLSDGGIRVWLDLPETETLAAAKLMACQIEGVYLQADLEPET